MTTDEPAERQSLFPDGILPAQLYRDRAVLAADVERCQAAGWELIQLDTATWSTPVEMHQQLAEGFGFPDYYGHNLDALNDVMADVAAGHYGFGPEAAGGIIALFGFDRFAAALPSQATAVMEILITGAEIALLFGWPLACLFQSDDPDLVLQPGPVRPVRWNPAERNRSDRAG